MNLSEIVRLSTKESMDRINNGNAFTPEREELLHRLQPDPARPVMSGPFARPDRSRAVLVVDDNPLMLKLGRALFGSMGHQVVTASSWVELSEALTSTDPSIIFMDVNLPTVKGSRLAGILKSQSRTKDVPIILMSDLPLRDLETLVAPSGANGCLRKPLTRHAVTEIFERFGIS